MRKLDDEIGILFKLLTKAKVKNDEVGCYGVKASLDGRYPYVYPRDLASVGSFLDMLITNDIRKNKALEYMEHFAEYLYHCQRKDGYVGQRYDQDFNDRSVYKQEDNVAHFIQVLAGFMLASGKLNKEYLKAIKRALKYALKNFYRDEINLFMSTTSIHESAICGGYDIWTNFAFHRAIRDIVQLEEKFGISIMDETIKELQAGTQAEHVFHFEERYLRGLSKEGEPDLRRDFICLSPFYFGIDRDSARIKETAKMLREDLWDPILGGLLRYQGYTEEFRMHMHAGNGPWLQYTSVLAQVFYYNKMQKAGDVVLRVIDKYRQPSGIPEHVSTKERFQEFLDLEWESGLDFAKEFDKSVLREDIKFDMIYEELGNMHDSYYKIKKGMANNPRMKYIIFSCPLIWSHSEYCKALAYREGKLI